MTASWDAGVFDRIYARAPDPWDFEGSAYERAKYDATLAALGARRFDHVLEIGCSIGVLTRRLGARAERVLALDGAQAALDQAAVRCRDMPWIEFRRAMVPAAFPDGMFDLILLSEVLYFLDADDVSRTASLAQDHLAPGGLVVLVNWTGETDTPTTGEQACALFQAAAQRLGVVGNMCVATYRIDVLAAPESKEGLVF
jgi:2-polyprenyl-3-methyl-5-hydroxy-6-metoxy-1,4-benzoquinol methylase